MREYSLVLPAVPASWYGGGWLAGNVMAHWFHLRSAGEVFWLWKSSSSGLRSEDKSLLEGKVVKLGAPDDIATISQKGFFYESNYGEITWQFKAKEIINLHNTKQLQKYLRDPAMTPFRREGWKKETIEESKRIALVRIVELARLDKPLSLRRFHYYSNPEDKIVPLVTSHLRSNAFVETPKQGFSISSIDYGAAIGDYLKDYLLDKRKTKALREYNLQQFLLLWLAKKGCEIESQGVVKNGRFDIWVKTEKERIAIELKLRDGDPALEQILGYMKHKRADRGVVICGNASENLIKRAKERQVQVVEFKTTFDIPDLDL